MKKSFFSILLLSAVFMGQIKGAALLEAGEEGDRELSQESAAA